MNARPALALIASSDDATAAVDDRALAEFGRDDIGNAERLRARHGADLRRTAGLGVLCWDGARWVLESDPPPNAMLRAQLTARAIKLEAKAIADEGKNLQGKAKEQNL